MIRLLLLLLLLLFILCTAAQSSPDSSGTNVLIIRDGYTRWVQQMRSLKHPVYKEFQNVDEACLKITVAIKPGAGDFTSIQDAVNAAPDLSHCRVVISIGPGTYTEKVVIHSSKTYLTLEGAGADRTIIQWASRAKELGKNGKPLSTYNTSTVGVDAHNFIAKNITFKNTAPLPRAGEPGGQGVALRISGDRGAFIGCRFLGSQDTLYDHMGRHYFKDCYIEGTIDFIFGNGRSMYDGCYLHGLYHYHGALTAQNRENMLDDTGFSFINCKVTGSGAFYLGRAWGTFSRVVFAYTYMDRVITPEGWDNWGDKKREMTVFYGQYKCTGPGADFAGRVSWSRELTPQEAKPFISISFIDGFDWLNL